MVHLVKKKIKGNVYLYLEETARINGKPTRIWQRYLGPESKIKEQAALQLEPEFTVRTVNFGLPVALMQIVKKLELIEIINHCTNKRSQGLSVGHYVVLAAINRCVKPTSKAKLKRWFENTALFEEFPPIETYLDSMAYRNHFKYITPEVIEAIELRISEKLIKEFKVSMDTLFYDPTNFFTYINPKEEAILPRHGHSKEGRSTLNLIGLALFCTADGGIPIFQEIYPGNVQDARLFKEQFPNFCNKLEKLGIDADDACLVFDKGNISRAVFEKIKASGIHFVCSIRPSTQKKYSHLKSSDFPLKMLPNGKEIGVLEFEEPVHGSNYRLLVVYNPSLQSWQEKNLKKKLEKKITSVHDWFKKRLNKNKWREPAAVAAKIRSLLGAKNFLELIDFKVSGTFGKVKYSIAIDDKALTSKVDSLGKTFLLSNHPTLSPFELAWLYRQQYTVERAFKYIKSPSLLSVRPIYHWTDESIRGHLFTCVLGLLLLMLLVRKIQRGFKKMSLFEIVEYLSEIELALVRYKGSRKVIKKIVEISPEARELSEFLKLNHFM